MTAIKVIYLSMQIFCNPGNISWDSLPMHVRDSLVQVLSDIDEYDQRYRARMGLPSLKEYLSEVGLNWDVEKYEKDLPEIEARFFHKLK